MAEVAVRAGAARSLRPRLRPRDRLDARSPPAVLRLGAEAVAVAALALGCAAWALQLWRADLSIPLRYAPVDDTKFYLALVKGIIDHGGYLTNPSLGAPFGQQLFDYPQGADDLSLLAIRAGGLLSSNPAVVINLFLLFTFAAVSGSSHLVLRRLGVSAPPAAVASVLFALLPYHFFRGESHLLLSAYYAVPLAALLFLELLAGTRLFARRAPPGRRRWRWLSGRTLATVALCAAIGSADLYYATFAVVLIAGATLILAVLRRGRSALEGLLVIGLVVGALAANLAPSFAYRLEHGANAVISRTAAADETTTEAFALRLTNLVLPVPESRIPPLRSVAARYDHAIAPGYCEACYASLGAVGTVGFGWLALGGLGALAGAGVGASAARRLWARQRLRHASVGVAIALAAGSVGGLSSLFEFFITPDIRAWNRISVLIAFFSLLSVALLLDALGARLRQRSAFGLLLAAVLAFGVFEQTTAQFVPAYAVTARQWRSDASFVAAIEARLPHGASVFQLPYVPFPEGYPDTPVGGALATYATKYEPLRGYLHSTSLRWSYGATKGRAQDWAAQLAGQPLPYVVAAASAAGFDGIWVDPAAFTPAGALALRSALVAQLGVAPLQSPDRDLWFFDLRPYRSRSLRSRPAGELALLRERTLHPLRSACQAGGLRLENPSGSPLPAILRVRLASGALVRRLTVPPGGSSVALAGTIRSATLTDARLAAFEGPGPIPGLTGPPCPR